MNFMLNQYFDHKQFKLVFTVAIACILVMLFDPQSTELLRYQHNEIMAGEIWRMVTANFTHSNWNHLLLNLSGLVLIDYLFQPMIKQKSRMFLLLFCLSTNVVILHYLIKLNWYVGLSGALHGYILGCAALTWSKAKITNSLIIVGVGLKLIAELNWEINSATAGLIEANVVEESHLAGAISAVVYSFVYYISHFSKNQMKQKKGCRLKAPFFS